MWSVEVVLGVAFLLFLAFQAGRSADAARERRLRELTAAEVRRLAEERERVAQERKRFVQERERYLEAVRVWREEGGSRATSGPARRP